jgi:hypothetical protein
MTERREELRDVLAGSDSDLSRHDLRELLDRVREVMHADTAAVLLRPPGGDHVVAHEACGLEEEVRQGVRVPLGAGFAGRIAATRRPVILDRVDATTVTNPILWHKGIQTMLGVPLVVEDELLGVLHVGRLTHNAFTSEDERLLQDAADRVAGAIRVRQLGDEAAAAALLERGLLPARLPTLPGLEFAARYVPAESRAIGGDWYDAFVAPNGELWLVTGDVAGHGLNAAVVMGRVRSALRAYTLLGEGPARVLELTDGKVQHFEIGAMVTVICATARPPYDEFHICSAGHLPPVLAAPGQRTELLDVQVGPPLGIVDLPRRTRRVSMPLGALLLLYTDGLVERRDESIERGLHRLRAAVHAESAEQVCRTVMRQLVGGEPVADDIALLAVHRT